MFYVSIILFTNSQVAFSLLLDSSLHSMQFLFYTQQATLNIMRSRYL